MRDISLASAHCRRFFFRRSTKKKHNVVAYEAIFYSKNVERSDSEQLLHLDFCTRNVKFRNKQKQP